MDWTQLHRNRRVCPRPIRGLVSIPGPLPMPASCSQYYSVGTDGFQSFTILWPAIYVPEAYITVLSPNNCPGIATFEDIANYVTNAGCCGGPRGVRDCFSARNANGGSDAIGTGYAPDHCPKNESLPMVDFTVDS